MKIFEITFCSDNGRKNFTTTVATLKDIEFDPGSIHVDPTTPNDPIIRKFLSDAFDYEQHNRSNEYDPKIFNTFSDVEYVNVFEIKYPLL